jgi:hypothetical protein
LRIARVLLADAALAISAVQLVFIARGLVDPKEYRDITRYMKRAALMTRSNWPERLSKSY